jgi:hypothetical protein
VYHMSKNSFALEAHMQCQHNVARSGARPRSALIVNDLCAQLAPLNRYGLPGFSHALVEGLRSLFGASRDASDAGGRCSA